MVTCWSASRLAPPELFPPSTDGNRREGLSWQQLAVRARPLRSFRGHPSQAKDKGADEPVRDGRAKLELAPKELVTAFYCRT